MTNTDTETAAARNIYRRIMARSEQTPATFNAAVEKALGSDTFPAAYVAAASLVRFPCCRCAATGIFARVWENGRPKNGGTCYRCQGTGSQDDADRRRNYGADMHAFAVAARAMMAG